MTREAKLALIHAAAQLLGQILVESAPNEAGIASVTVATDALAIAVKAIESETKS
jgi:hypothetical protein